MTEKLLYRLERSEDVYMKHDWSTQHWPKKPALPQNTKFTDWILQDYIKVKTKAKLKLTLNVQMHLNEFGDGGEKGLLAATSILRYFWWRLETVLEMLSTTYKVMDVEYYWSKKHYMFDNIIDEHVMPFAQFIVRNFLFMQDNIRCGCCDCYIAKGG